MKTSHLLYVMINNISIHYIHRLRLTSRKQHGRSYIIDIIKPNLTKVCNLSWGPGGSFITFNTQLTVSFWQDDVREINEFKARYPGDDS